MPLHLHEAAVVAVAAAVVAAVAVVGVNVVSGGAGDAALAEHHGPVGWL